MTVPATTYTPRPGSVADRAWQHLNAFGEMAGRPLCDAIDLDDHGALQACLGVAIAHGYIVKRKDGGLNYYRCGDGTPPPAEHDDDPPLQRVVPAHAAPPVKKPRASTPEELAPQHVLKAEGASPDATDHGAPDNASPVGGPMGAGQPAAAGPSAAFRCALFSDGELRIEWRGQIIELEAGHTRQLVAYLDRLALEPTA